MLEKHTWIIGSSLDSTTLLLLTYLFASFCTLSTLACGDSATLTRCPFESFPISSLPSPSLPSAEGAFKGGVYLSHVKSPEAIVFMDCMVKEKQPHDRSAMLEVVRIARLFNPLAKIILATENRTDAEMNLFCRFHISLRDCSCLRPPEEDAFKKVYIHSSINIFEKELFCFLRFFKLRQLVVQETLERVLFVDADIFLMSNILERLSLTPPWQLRIPFHSATYLSMWQAPAIALFVQFMIDFYSRPHSSVTMDIRKYGSSKFTSKHPRFVAQFSDMSMLKAFVSSGKVVAQVDYPNTHDVVHGGRIDITAAISMRVAFQNTSACREDFATFSQRFVWRSDMAQNGAKVQLPLASVGGQERPMIGIHMQGVQCKRLIRHFAEKICPIEQQLIAERTATMKGMDVTLHAMDGDGKSLSNNSSKLQSAGLGQVKGDQEKEITSKK